MRVGDTRGAWGLPAAIAASVAGLCACSSGSVSGGPGDASIDAPVLVVPVVDGAAPVVDASLPEASVDAAPAPDAADAGAVEAGACTWDGSVESPACSRCLQTMCCDVTAACEDDPACVALDTCVNGCLTSGGGDAGSQSACQQGCADQQTQTVRDAYQAWDLCLGSSCGGNSGQGPCL